MFEFLRKLRLARGDIARALRLSRNIDSRTRKIELSLAKVEAAIAGRGRSVPLIEFFRLPENGMKCPICSNGKIAWSSAYPSNHERFRMASILYCEGCGSGFVPDADKILSGYYDAEYGASRKRHRLPPPESFFSSSGRGSGAQRKFLRAQEQTESLRRNGARFIDVLDYGSRAGYFLYICSAENPFAVELDAHSYKYLEYINARRISYEEIGEECFDVVVASHVIEHLSEMTLAQTLERLATSLRPGGLMLVEVPTGAHTFIARKSEQAPHTLFFTPDGIRIAVANAGLEIVDCYAGNSVVAAPRENPVYHPDQSDAFSKATTGGLTVIARRR